MRAAERRTELPTVIGALVAGELSVDAVIEIARLAPATHEASISAFAHDATVPQLRRCLRNYGYDADAPAGDPTADDGPVPGAGAAAHPCTAPGEGSTGGSDPAAGVVEGSGEDVPSTATDAGTDTAPIEAAARRERGGRGATPVEEQRSASMGTDERGWWLNARLPLDEGAVIEAAVKAARDDLYRQRRLEDPDGPAPSVTWADGLLAVAEASLRSGEARHPGSDRYLVHLHLDATPTPADPTGTLALHLGPPLPTALRHLLTCDTGLRPVFEAHGQPLAVGRRTRSVSRRLRRLVEHRDGSCRVPGCDRTTKLDIHHLEHWAHGGATDPDNLTSPQ